MPVAPGAAEAGRGPSQCRAAWGRVRAAGALLLLAGLAACAAGATRTSADPFAGGSSGSSRASARQITIEVQNSNFNEATIDARGVGIRQRLGRVAGTRSDRFTLNWPGSGAIYFEVDLLGGESCVSRAINANAGDTIRLVIDSTARIRPDGTSRLCDAQRSR